MDEHWWESQTDPDSKLVPISKAALKFISMDSLTFG